MPRNGGRDEPTHSGETLPGQAPRRLDYPRAIRHHALAGCAGPGAPVRFPPRIVQCPKCLYRFDADSDVIIFALLGLVLGFILALAVTERWKHDGHGFFVWAWIVRDDTPGDD
jgi:hypothetical protein